METTRRLSLTLLLVAPLITAQEIQTPDLSLSSISGEHLPIDIRPKKPNNEEYDDQEEIGTSTTMDSITTTQHADEKLGRERRGYISSAEDMEVAEQVVFRPYFRHRQVLPDRKLDKDEAVRKQSLEQATVLGQAYNPYQYNYYYPLGVSRSRRSVEPTLTSSCSTFPIHREFIALKLQGSSNTKL